MNIGDQDTVSTVVHKVQELQVYLAGLLPCLLIRIKSTI